MLAFVILQTTLTTLINHSPTAAFQTTILLAWTVFMTRVPKIGDGSFIVVPCHVSTCGCF